MGSKLAIFGGAPVIPGEPNFRSVFDHSIYPKIKTMLMSRPLSTLFGDYDVKELEESFAAYCGSRYAVAMNSGTSSLHAALVALDISEGDEVAVTSFSFIASASVIREVNATPIFIDICPETLTMDPADLRAKISSRTKAVICVHIFGTPCRMKEIVDICASHKLNLIEDACQALGAKVKGKSAGTIGDIGCFSFNVNKLVQCGEGGMFVTNDSNLAETARELRVNGLSPFGYQRMGFNYTMTNLQALLAAHQIPMIPKFVDTRRKYAEMLKKALSNYALLPENAHSESERVDYAVPIILCSENQSIRDVIIEALIKEGVAISGLYTIMYHHEFLKRYEPKTPCVNAEDIIPRLISINPSHLYDEDHVHKICEALHKVLSQTSALKEHSLRL